MVDRENLKKFKDHTINLLNVISANYSKKSSTKKVFALSDRIFFKIHLYNIIRHIFKNTFFVALP